MKDVSANMEKMNRYQFDGGVAGLAKMAAQASMLRFDMAQTFSFADRMLTPENAINMASAFQRLGVTAGNLVDPFVLMNESINDPTGVGLDTTTTQLFWQIARNNSSTQLLHGLNAIVSTVTQSSTTRPNLNVFFGAANTGNAGFFDNLEMALCYLSGDALSSQNMIDMYNAVQAFQTTLSRQV
jgi:hypothetical protein